MSGVGIEMVGAPDRGRVFTSRSRVRLADVTASGRLRLDALARHLQDLSADDTADAIDAGWASDDVVWVLRRLDLLLGPLPRYRDEVEGRTWCSGLGPRWAERRSDLVVEGSVAVRAAALWAATDRTTFAPVRLGAEFARVHGEAAAGRTVSARLRLTDPPAAASGAWAVRATDIDLLGHVNNAAYWASAEDVIADDPVGPIAATIEFRGGVVASEPVELRERRSPGSLEQWWFVRGEPRAAMLLTWAG